MHALSVVNKLSATSLLYLHVESPNSRNCTNRQWEMLIQGRMIHSDCQKNLPLALPRCRNVRIAVIPTLPWLNYRDTRVWSCIKVTQRCHICFISVRCHNTTAHSFHKCLRPRACHRTAYRTTAPPAFNLWNAPLQAALYYGHILLYILRRAHTVTNKMPLVVPFKTSHNSTNAQSTLRHQSMPPNA